MVEDKKGAKKAPEKKAGKEGKESKDKPVVDE